MAGITTHVLDTARGLPAAGIPITLHCGDVLLAEGVTDADGRLRVLSPEAVEIATYRITFDVAAYNPDGFFPKVTIEFRVTNIEQHYHVPLLLSPFGYSTYRGS
jgi:5-hydroxyisourate hydrolase